MKATITKLPKTSTKSTKDNALGQLVTVLATTGDLLQLPKAKDWAVSTMSSLSKLIELDAAGQRHQVQLGELYHKILGLPVEKQKELTAAWAKVQGVPAPTYEQTGVGRPTTGRKELAAVLYAKHPEWLVKEDDSNDTAAARRISQCILVYKYESGLATRPERLIGPAAEEKKISAPQLRRSFTMLYGLTRSSDEQESLILLYRRAGVTGKELDKWTTQAKDDVIETTATVSPLPVAAEERRA